MKINAFASTLIFLSFMSTQAQVTYPQTPKIDHKEIYFGKEISDPYRWLEDDHSEETSKWVKTENQTTYTYLEQIPYREKIKNQLTDLWNYEKISAPFKKGKFTYFYKNNGLQQHAVLYRKTTTGKEEVFLDPNTFSKDGSISLADVSFSKDGSLCAYNISEGGSDWNKIIVINAVSKEVIETLTDIKFSSANWLENKGFFYSTYEKPKGSVLTELTDKHQLLFHLINTPQSKDELVFGGQKTPRRYVEGFVTEDEKYLIISAANSTTGNELYIKDLSQENSELKTIIGDFDTSTELAYNDGKTLYLLTNFQAPNNRLVAVDFDNLKAKWQDIIPEKPETLNISTANGYVFAHYLKDAITKIEQHELKGKLVREVSLPGIGTASGFSSKKNDEDIYFTFSNYITPTSVYQFNAKDGQSKLLIKPNIKFNSDNYESKQVFYTSSDGTKVPMVITYKKGLKLDGKNPTILYGYGGFNISLTPSFSVVTAVWLENGGIYAVANLRGGGEYGQKWHDGGRQLNKKNVFNDFISAAKYLKENKYTSTDYLALSGGSNGGLLVGATMTIQPDLAKVALPAVGVLDMLRYHTFTAGAGWAYDYGTANDNKEMFEYLLSYSPVHNVKKGVCYPTTMVTTGDHDDRVVPSHSFKFAAELQDKQSCANPVLIRIDTNAGHGAGKSTQATINENSDKLAFTLWNMGYKELK